MVASILVAYGSSSPTDPTASAAWRPSGWQDEFFCDLTARTAVRIGQLASR